MNSDIVDDLDEMWKFVWLDL